METKIVTKYDGDSVMSLLDKALIHFDILNPGMFGFIGRMNKENKTFWIVNHSNVYRTRAGLKFKTYRRFEGQVKEGLHTTQIEGSFRMRPLFKFTIAIFVAFNLAILTLGLFFSESIEVTLKLIAITMAMLAGLGGVVAFNLSKTKTSEKEIIEFIEEIVGDK